MMLTSEVWCFCHYTLLLSDISCALSIVSNSVKNELTKHIGVDASFVHAVVQDSGYYPSVCAYRVTVGGFL